MSESTEKPRRVRATRAKEPTGPVNPREMTKIRDEVGEIRELARTTGAIQVEQRLEALWTKLDRLDLRFKVHHDPSSKKKAEA